MTRDRDLPLENSSRPASRGVSRRQFLKAGAAVGGGLLLSLRLPFAGGEAEAADPSNFAPNAFIRIGRDGKIVLVMPYVEMGQGTYTSIPMLIAEELEVDLKQVHLEHAPPNEKLYANPLIGVQATGNSNAIRGAWQPLRQAGATARTMLVAAAAGRWNVDPSSCHAQSGEVLHAVAQVVIEIRLGGHVGAISPGNAVIISADVHQQVLLGLACAAGLRQRAPGRGRQSGACRQGFSEISSLHHVSAPCN